MDDMNTDYLLKMLSDAKSEKEVRDIFSEKREDKSAAQMLYSVLKKEMEQDVKSLQKAFQGKINWKGPDIVNYQKQYISNKAADFFEQINTPFDCSSIFYEVIEKQKQEKQKEIKDNLEKSGNELWHFSKHDISTQDELHPAGCPNYPRDQFIVGVFAVPSKVGTYTLRSDFPDGDFYLDKYALLYSDEKPDLSKVYGYGYKLNAQNFTPTVSNDGIYAGEWTSPVAEKISDKVPVTLNHIMDQGCTIYNVSKENKEYVKGELKGLYGTERQKKIETLCSLGKVENINISRNMQKLHKVRKKIAHNTDKASEKPAKEKPLPKDFKKISLLNDAFSRN